MAGRTPGLQRAQTHRRSCPDARIPHRRQCENQPTYLSHRPPRRPRASVRGHSKKIQAHRSDSLIWRVFRGGSASHLAPCRSSSSGRDTPAEATSSTTRETHLSADCRRRSRSPFFAPATRISRLPMRFRLRGASRRSRWSPQHACLARSFVCGTALSAYGNVTRDVSRGGHLSADCRRRSRRGKKRKGKPNRDENGALTERAVSIRYSFSLQFSRIARDGSPQQACPTRDRFSFACINAEPPSRRDREGFLGLVSASRRHGDEKGSLARQEAGQALSAHGNVTRDVSRGGHLSAACRRRSRGGTKNEKGKPIETKTLRRLSAPSLFVVRYSLFLTGFLSALCGYGFSTTRALRTVR